MTASSLRHIIGTFGAFLARWAGRASKAKDAAAAPSVPESCHHAEEDVAPFSHATMAGHVPYDENLLERARTQWQFGDWESLAKLNQDTLQHHPDRAKLALMAAAGNLQINRASTAKQLLGLARDWGCSDKMISQILIGCVHNSLGRAMLASGRQAQALGHFTKAVALASPGNDVRLISQARLALQSSQLGMATAAPLSGLRLPSQDDGIEGVSAAAEPRGAGEKQAAVASIAILRLDNIGDHVLGSPLLRGLRHQNPEARIVMIAPTVVADYYKHCPWIDGLIALPARRALHYSAADLAEIRDIVATHQGEPFDILVNPRFAEDYYHANIISSYLQARRRVAFWQNRTVIDELDPNQYYDDLIVVADDSQHTVEYSYRLLDYLGVHERPRPEVWFTRDELKSVADKAGLDIGNGSKISERFIIVVGIGASCRNRIWPRESYAEFVGKLPQRLDKMSARTLIVLVGSAAERATGDFIAGQAGCCISLVGNTTLSELAALCSLAHLYIGPDSGPKHIAAASGCPVIEISHFPAGHQSRARSSDTAGRCWSAVNVYTRSIFPASIYSDAQLESGKAIASISPQDLLEVVMEFVAAPEFAATLS